MRHPARNAAAMVAGLLLLVGCARSLSGDAGRAVGATALPDLSTSPAVPGPPASVSSATTSTMTSTSAPVSTAPPTRTKTSTSTSVSWQLPLPGPNRSARNKFGNTVAKVGQPYGITWAADHQVALLFVVDSIKVDAGCDRPAKPVNGHFLIISLRVQVGAAAGKALREEGIGFTDGNWTVFDAKDTAQGSPSTTASSDCLDYNSSLPIWSEAEAGRLYTGKVALDVSSTKGTALLMDDVTGGWIYHYG
jgi:hypothetical protein